MELIADQKPVRNNAGYVGVTDIDDSDDYSRYRISVEGEEVNAKEPLCLLLRYIDPDGKTEACIGDLLNPAVKRFQKYSEDIPPEFKSEIQILNISVARQMMLVSRYTGKERDTESATTALRSGPHASSKRRRFRLSGRSPCRGPARRRRPARGPLLPGGERTGPSALT